MNRRRFLSGVGVVGLSSVAGCSTEEDPSPTDTPTDSPTNTPTKEPTETEEPKAKFELVYLSPISKQFQQGEIIQLKVKVINRGDIKGTKSVKLELDNEVVDSTDITLEPGENKTYNHTLNSTNIDAGEYRFELSTEDDSVNTDLTIDWSDKKILEIMDLTLEVFGLNMVESSIEEDVAVITYETLSTSAAEIRNDIRDVSEAYHGAVLQGISTDRLNAKMAEPGEEPIGAYYIQNEWILEIENGEITESELVDKIIDTLEYIES
jgi:hypothetical protein